MNKFYKNLDLNINFFKEVLKFWNQENIFQESIEKNSNNAKFIFYEGPPSANGLPGIHHVVGRTIKDIFSRYKTMKGNFVERKAGWDTHGLPVELAAEKFLKIKKEDIGNKISIEDYNKTCKELVLEFKSKWEDITKKIGYWIDTEDPYMTCNNSYIESIWSIVKKIYDKKLLYKGYSVQPYSPMSGTSLSSHELNQVGCYKNVKDISITVLFKILDRNEYFLAWTTTPWTLPANVALCINKNIEYVKIKTFNRYSEEIIFCILAKDCLKNFFSKDDFSDSDFENFKKTDKDVPYRIINRFLGEELLGIRYEQLMPYIKPENDSFFVIHGDFVKTESGSGIVHIAPSFGVEDMKVAKTNEIEEIFVLDEENKKVPIVNKKGKYVKEITDFADKFIKKEYEEEVISSDPSYKSVDELIAIKLKSENKAFLVKKYEHSYPHCWRTDTPIIYYPIDAWFIKTSEIKNRLIELNKEIKWIPAHIGEGRFGNWLENLVDWNISRDRFWGTPLPIWKTFDKTEEKCIGSFEELKKEIKKSISFGFMKKNIDDNFDLHRPFIDEIILVSDNGKKMVRENDILDVWFDSGAMPYAQENYLFDKEEKKNFTADFISEGIDQTRGWFFTLHVLSVILFDTIAFKNVLVNGLVLDKNGIKMSKRLGNTIDPFELIDRFGPDAIRFYIISSFNIFDTIKFDQEEIKETSNKFFGTLENSYKFFSTYANIENYKAKEVLNENFFLKIDNWIVSKLHSIIKEVENFYEKYDAKSAALAIENFVIEDLSNWYIRQNRKRFWKSEFDKSKIDSYDILYTCLLNICKISAPIIPFTSEKIFKSLTDEESVHLLNFPTFSKEKINISIEKQMSLAQKISSMIHNLRKKNKIKVRQPLSRVMIYSTKSSDINDIEEVKEIILNETNIKKLEFVDSSFISVEKIIKPNFEFITKKNFKDEAKEIIIAISKMNENQKKYFLEKNTIDLILPISKKKKKITHENFLIIQKDLEGFSSACFETISLTIDLNISKDLILEGLAREFVNKIQNLRKNENFDVIDKIYLEINSQNNDFIEAIKNHYNYISLEIQALNIDFTEKKENMKKIEIEDFEFFIDIKKI
jgi:isoleucyl-tRNA synthetase